PTDRPGVRGPARQGTQWEVRQGGRGDGSVVGGGPGEGADAPPLPGRWRVRGDGRRRDRQVKGREVAERLPQAGRRPLVPRKPRQRRAEVPTALTYRERH